MNSFTTDESISHASVESPARLAENWQRCRQEDLPKAFYVYDRAELRSERVVTYRLAGSAPGNMAETMIDALTDMINDPAKFNFIVRLGLRPERLKGEITTEPAFALFLQVNNIGEEDDNWEDNCIEMTWKNDGYFSTAQSAYPDSEANAIPAASAYLFVYSWLETPEKDLARPFTAATRTLGERVKAYIFSPAESRSIYNDLKHSTKNELQVHLGRGLAVWVHPFSFRPVIEVKGAVKGGIYADPVRESTGLSNLPLDDDGDGDGDSFYDYSHPDPPGYPD